ncbi:hypothetical protein AKJ64_02850 [candidate division MSBL1 archaeon SCGC-AAA259E17]|uniref:PIN domain-containing protein n=1 Tax=candidate division MSBL1 archaeon SCGC-AAA259E17 TaxID=1698263 RepID=A0A133UEB5_9EURY|nr:hypothetical protein AKJ64_02850 [candidate division MSBL1 archaeon SCGC-AAA259E17]
MPQTVLLDTNVMLDYLENRNSEVQDIVATILHFHNRGAIEVATTVFNIAELIDKLFQIYVIGNLMSERLSYDEIQKKKGDMVLFRDVSENNREKIRKEVRNFIFGKDIRILPLS